IPLYMRADLVRQTSRTSFEARDAILTTSEFAQPHFAIGAGRLTLKQIEQEEGGLEQRFTATHTTFNVLGVPTFYWPFLAGQTNDVPLRRISAGYSNQTGPEVTTRWDLFALAGRQRPENVDMLLALDYLGDHGPGTGVELEYDRDAMFGRLDSYLLPNDNGEDDIGGRPIEIEHDGETRGFFRWQHRHELAQGWELSLEGAYVSDETFLEEFFRDEAYEAKPYETSLYLKKQQDEWAADLLASVQTTDFLPQLTTLQTPGYAVEKLPELRYFRMGTSLWDGRLTWFSENRISRVRADFGEDAPEDRGFSNSASQLLFGIPATTTFEDAADAMMFPDDWRWRADTRQEITAPMKLGILDVVPYAAGRITAYDEDFEEFSGQDDQARLWGAVGTRFHTTFTSQANDFESQILDVHRLRHIIEPSVDVFLMGSTVSASDLPVYDTDVESVSEGSGVRLGLLNTWQTQRGGPGRWRSVDWITLQTDLVLRSSDADTDAAIARFYPYRPEYGIGQDHFYTQLMWMVSDTLGVVGELTYNLQGDEGVAHWRLGATLQHTPRLNSFLNYEEIDILDSRLLTYGFTYQLTTKYTLSFAQRWDLGQRESRDLSVWLERKLPRWRFRVVASIDELDDEQMIGVVLVPEGITGGVSPIRLIEPSRN
ncbi:MAG TPA: LPS assembly protein LptD, partial [Phycisphaeraceae bacterium]